MAGVKHSMGVIVGQPLGEADQFVSRLMAVEQMESPHDRPDRTRACRQDILQTTVCAAREKQATSIERQLVSEIIEEEIPLSVLDEQMPVALGHGVSVRNMSHDMDAIGHLTGVVDHDEPLSHSLRPHCGDAMQVISPGIEHPVDSLQRNDDFRPLVDIHEMTESSGMVAVAVGDEDVIYRAKINAHPLGIKDEHITGPCIEQDAVALRFQQD